MKVITPRILSFYVIFSLVVGGFAAFLVVEDHTEVSAASPKTLIVDANGGGNYTKIQYATIEPEVLPPADK